MSLQPQSLRESAKRLRQHERAVELASKAREAADLHVVNLIKQTDPDKPKELAAFSVARQKADVATLTFARAQDQFEGARGALEAEYISWADGWCNFVSHRKELVKKDFVSSNLRFGFERRELEDYMIPLFHEIERLGFASQLTGGELPFELDRFACSLADKISRSCQKYEWTLPEAWPLAPGLAPVSAAAVLTMRQRSVLALAVELADAPKPAVLDKLPANHVTIARLRTVREQLVQQLSAPDWQAPEMVKVRVKEDCTFGVRVVNVPGATAFPVAWPVIPEPDEKIERAEARLGVKRLKKGQLAEIVPWDFRALSAKFERLQS